MIRTLPLTILTLTALACATLQTAKAAGPETNLVQTINLKLTIYGEGDTTTNASTITTPVLKLSKATKDIIQLLGEATGDTFTPKAKLILVTTLGDSEDSRIFVRDGTNDVDVSGFFSYDQSSEHVQALTVNTATGTGKGTDYRIMELSMHDNGGQILAAHFDVGGLSTDKISTIVSSGAVIGEAHQISATLAGHGDITDGGGQHTLILQVSLTVVGSALEVH